MNYRTLVALAIASAFLSACAPNDPGPAPTNYKQQIAQYVRSNYFDPYSLQDVAIGRPVFSHGMTRSSWAVCFQANAKNQFGGYVGLRLSVYTFRNGQIDAADVDAYIVPEACTPGILTPWPELLRDSALPAPPPAAAAVPTPAGDPSAIGLLVITLSPNHPAALRSPGLKGVQVVSVTAESPADKAGVKSGDVIMACDGKPIASYSDLSAALTAGAGGKTVTLELAHWDAVPDTKVTLPR